MSWFDPNSFKGKCLLLLVDKILIGAIIGVAIICYEHHKTNDDRQYNEIFKHAEYIKELLPIVTDESKDATQRAHALYSLINTQSIDANSSFNLANNILITTILDTVAEIPIIGNRSHYELYDNYFNGADITLENGLKNLLPSGFEQLLFEYQVILDLQESTKGKNKIDYQSFMRRRLRQVDGFWIRLFVNMLNNHTDGELNILNLESLIERNFNALKELSRRAPRYDSTFLKKSLQSPLLTLRIFGSMWLLRDSVSTPLPYAENVLQNILRSDKSCIVSYGIKQRVIHTMRLNEIVTVNLFNHLINQYKRFTAKATNNSSQINYEEGFYSMVLDYLKWALDKRRIIESISSDDIEFVQNS